MKKFWMGFAAVAMVSAATATAWGDEEVPAPAADEAAPAVAMPAEVDLGLCIRTALERNLGLQMARLSREEADLDVAVARGAYDPSLSLSVERDHSETEGESAGTADGALETIRTERDEDTVSASIGGKIGPGGGSYELAARNGDSSGKRGGNPFDSNTGRVGVTLKQPLLKGFKTDETRYRIATAKVQSQESALALEQEVQELLGDVEKAWYALMAAKESREVQLEAVRLSEQLLADNRRKVKIGTMSALDEKQAESQAASARADLAAAEQSIVKAENSLKALVWNDLRSIWSSEVPSTGSLAEPPADATAPDAGAAMEVALASRPDLRSARLSVERQGYAVDLYRNQRLPALDLIAGGGLQASDEKSESDVWSTISDADEPYWNVGVTLSIPLGNRAARNRYLQSQATAERMRLQVRRQEEAAMAEVVNASAEVRSCLLRVAATTDAAEYAAAALDAEQRKLDQGRSTSFVVLQLQKNLTDARRAKTSALADYHKSLVDFALAEGTMLERHGLEMGTLE